MKALLASCFAAAALGAAVPAALAGPVTVQSGQVVMSFDAGDGDGETRRTFPVAFPESRTVEWDGAGDDGVPRGTGRVTYALEDADDAATFTATAHTTHASPDPAAGSRTEFVLSFTTDRAMHYQLVGNLLSTDRFEVRLDEFSAVAETDPDGFPSGSWPIHRGDSRGDIFYERLARNGVLAAGPHTLLVLAEARARGEDDDFDPSTTGTIELALTAEAPNVIPLPAAAWSGLALLGAIVSAKVRARHGTR